LGLDISQSAYFAQYSTCDHVFDFDYLYVDRFDSKSVWIARGFRKVGKVGKFCWWL